jgi:Lysophospholipase L1 and related esterases
MRICFIGDSFVNGTGDPLCQGWSGRAVSRARLAGRDITHYSLGIRRDTSRDVAARWRQEAARRLPDGVDGRLVFSFGVNDCVEESGRPRVAPGVTLDSAGSVLGEAAAWRPTLMVGPPPIAEAGANARILALSCALARLCESLGVPFLDVFTPLAADPVWRAETAAGDGAHPGAAGYDLLAGLVASWPAWQAWTDQPR